VTLSLARADVERSQRWREVLLRDGTVNYRVRDPRPDECWTTACATVLQVPLDEMPDFALDERRRGGEDPEEISRSARHEMDAWLAARGLRMVRHRSVPVARARWVGVVPMPGIFRDHSMAMSFGEVLCDPTLDFQLVALAKFLPADELAALHRIRIRPRIWRPEDVRWGYSFQKLARPTRREVTRWRHG
jgi:hypothetical protein